LRPSLPALTLGALTLGTGAATPALAADLAVTFEVPQLKVAEYHRPYVALWLEGADEAKAADLAVLYDTKKANGEGQKWLKDLRAWWRKGGRDLKLPADGVSGATRAPGAQTLTFSGNRFSRLPAGQYFVVIEAVREVGGRETLKLPIQLPLKAGGAQTARGASELGAFTVVGK
jgi:hypothetical protein